MDESGSLEYRRLKRSWLTSLAIGDAHKLFENNKLRKVNDSQSKVPTILLEFDFYDGPTGGKKEMFAKIMASPEDRSSRERMDDEGYHEHRINQAIGRDNPFVIQHLSTFSLDSKHLEIILSGINSGKQILQNFNEKKGYNHDYVDMMFFERGYTRLDQFMSMRRKEGDEQRWMSIIIQLLFCICSLEKKGVYHNDLHAFNIFIDYIPLTRFELYMDENGCLEFTTDVMVKIFDFKNATKISTEFSAFEITGPKSECDFQPGHDAYTILHDLFIHKHLPDEDKEFIENYIEPISSMEPYGDTLTIRHVDARRVLNGCKSQLDTQSILLDYYDYNFHVLENDEDPEQYITAKLPSVRYITPSKF